MQRKIPQINYKTYFGGSLLVLGLILYFTGINRNITASAIVYIGTLLNHYMLYAAGKELLGKEDADRNGLKILVYFVGKSVILALALYAAYKMAPALVLYSLVQYIFQLIILFLSIKRY